MKLNIAWVKTISILYLASPLMLFLATWLKVPYAMIGVFLLGSLIASVIGSFRRENQEYARIDALHACALVVFAALWISQSGIGGFSSQNTDYAKHNAILHTLMSQDWPVAVPEAFQYDRLVYYFGHYLIPAAIGKQAGWYAANASSAAWAFIGLLLSFTWIGILTRSFHWRVYVFFILAGGLDVVGYFFLKGSWPLRGQHIEWWNASLVAQYSSNTTLLFWVPQHALGAWIGTSLILSCEKRSSALVLFVLTPVLMLFWSPFAALGALPIAALKLFETLKALGLRIRDFPPVPFLSALAIALLLLTFFRSIDTRAIPHGFPMHNGAIFNYIIILTTFLFLEYLAFIPFIFERSRLLLLTSLMLAVLPLYWVGMYNDFTMRTSIPALFFIWVCVCRKLNELFSRKPIASFAHPLFILWAIGSATAICEITRSIDAAPALFSWNVPDERYSFSILRAGPDGAAAQYLGDRDGFFFRFLAKNP